MFRRPLIATLLTATVAAFTAVAAPPSQARQLPVPTPVTTPKLIPESLLGMHIHGLSHPNWEADRQFGAIRLWDNGIRWDEINTASNVYNFALMDEVVGEAEQAIGSQGHILYVLGSTPQWLATPTKNTPENYLGAEGANTPPRTVKEWDKWVTTVATRYKGRIDSYQVWNEVNFASFWTGTPQQMAELTRRAARIIWAVDPQAEVVTGSGVVRLNSAGKQSAKPNRASFLHQYLKRLKPSNYDAVGVHLYPWRKAGPGDGTPQDREKAAAEMRNLLHRLGSRKPMYDTEMAYGNRRDNGWPTRVIPESRAADWLAQTYVYGLSNTVEKVFWYGWDDHVLGVDVTDPATSAPLLPATAYTTVMSWLKGARSHGCVTKQGVHVCRLSNSAGVTQLIAFTTSPRAGTYHLPRKAGTYTTTCHISGACETVPSPLKKVRVTASPTLIAGVW